MDDSVTDIKNVIATLCKHLNLLLNVNIKPEVFRLAKYNESKDNVVEVFWNILNKISKNSTSMDVENVKNYLFAQKYDCEPFYTLPNDMSHGSRELLLAFGFILSKNILNDLVNDEVSSSPLDRKFEMYNSENVCKRMLFERKMYENYEDHENLLQWLQGKTDLNLRMIKEYQLCSDKLLQKLKLNVDCLAVKTENLTETEIIALNNEEFCKLFLQNTEKVNKILEHHEIWLKKEHTFWKWMASVLMEREKEIGIHKRRRDKREH